MTREDKQKSAAVREFILAPSQKMVDDPKYAAIKLFTQDWNARTVQLLNGLYMTIVQ